MTVRYLEAAERDKMEAHKRELMRQSQASPVRRILKDEFAHIKSEYGDRQRVNRSRE